MASVQDCVLSTLVNMKFLVVLFVAVVVVSAEPPRYKFQRQFQRQEAAPYPAAGYKPAVPFRLPTRLERLPEAYGPPATYGPPPASYGPPEAGTTEAAETTTTEQPIEPTDEPAQRFTSAKFRNAKLIGKEAEAEEVEVDGQDSKKAQDPQEGIYYILLPTGQLQKVQYVTMGNLASPAYSAQLQFENVSPIKGPIFAIGPNSQLVQYV